MTRDLSLPTRTPEFVVFTGVDEETDVGRMREMSARWPIEWGVLVSKSRSGSDPRYPRLDMGKRLADGRLRLAAHLCGRWAVQVFEDRPDRDPEIVDVVGGLYGRIQLNVVHGERGVVAKVAELFGRPHAGPDEGRETARRVAATVARLGALRAVLQCRSDVFPDATEVDWLFDRSGGFGKVPDAWPEPAPGEASRKAGPHRIGYAGGLGPETVLDALARFPAARVRSSYWIDMETHVRTDDRFDLDKCEAVCRAVWGLSIEG